MPVIASIVQQHVDDAAHLRLMRSRLVRAPHVSMRQLARHDERMAANLDGIAVAGTYGDELVAALLLDSPGRGEVFSGAVRAIVSGRHEALESLYALCENAAGDACAGLLSAMGWVSRADLRGIGRALLASQRPTRRGWGLAACAMHEVDPGAALARALDDADAQLRSRALRVAVRCGRSDLLETCAAATRTDEAESACRAVHACVLLGERGAALDRLPGLAFDPAVSGHTAAAALRTSLRVQPSAQARAVLAQLAKASEPPLAAVRAVGVAGDPRYVPWLLEQMRKPETARAAAESFAAITGIELARFDLEERPSADDDGSADLGEDADLPWPDIAKIGRWWDANRGRFTAGERYFVGQPPSLAHCQAVLHGGLQRQRTAAAEYLVLLQPGTPAFDVAAPGWRQQRRLAERSAAA